MSAAKHDINAEQGSTFKLYVEYQTAGATAVDLHEYDANMNVRRFASSSKLLLDLSGSTAGRGITSGGVTGEYSKSDSYRGVATGGVKGAGGVWLNAHINGSTGGTAGTTGGIYIDIPSSIMRNVADGNHFYDLELIYGPTGDVTRILEGRFVVNSEVTK